MRIRAVSLYHRKALNSRKENKPKARALEMAGQAHGMTIDRIAIRRPVTV
jgi:hypothetical protein